MLEFGNYCINRSRYKALSTAVHLGSFVDTDSILGMNCEIFGSVNRSEIGDSCIIYGYVELYY